MKKITKDVIEFICLAIIVIAIVSIANDTKTIVGVFKDPTTYSVTYEQKMIKINLKVPSASKKKFRGIQRRIKKDYYFKGLS